MRGDKKKREKKKEMGLKLVYLVGSDFVIIVDNLQHSLLNIVQCCRFMRCIIGDRSARCHLFAQYIYEMWGYGFFDVSKKKKNKTRVASTSTGLRHRSGIDLFMSAAAPFVFIAVVVVVVFGDNLPVIE